MEYMKMELMNELWDNNDFDADLSDVHKHIEMLFKEKDYVVLPPLADKVTEYGYNAAIIASEKTEQSFGAREGSVESPSSCFRRFGTQIVHDINYSCYQNAENAPGPCDEQFFSSLSFSQSVVDQFFSDFELDFVASIKKLPIVHSSMTSDKKSPKKRGKKKTAKAESPADQLLPNGAEESLTENPSEILSLFMMKCIGDTNVTSYFIAMMILLKLNINNKSSQYSHLPLGRFFAAIFNKDIVLPVNINENISSVVGNIVVEVVVNDANEDVVGDFFLDSGCLVKDVLTAGTGKFIVGFEDSNSLQKALDLDGKTIEQSIVRVSKFSSIFKNPYQSLLLEMISQSKCDSSGDSEGMVLSESDNKTSINLQDEMILESESENSNSNANSKDANTIISTFSSVGLVTSIRPFSTPANVNIPFSEVLVSILLMLSLSCDDFEEADPAENLNVLGNVLSPKEKSAWKAASYKLDIQVSKIDFMLINWLIEFMLQELQNVIYKGDSIFSTTCDNVFKQFQTITWCIYNLMRVLKVILTNCYDAGVSQDEVGFGILKDNDTAVDLNSTPMVYKILGNIENILGISLISSVERSSNLSQAFSKASEVFSTYANSTTSASMCIHVLRRQCIRTLSHGFTMFFHKHDQRESIWRHLITTAMNNISPDHNILPKFIPLTDNLPKGYYETLLLYYTFTDLELSEVLDVNRLLMPPEIVDEVYASTSDDHTEQIRKKTKFVKPNARASPEMTQPSGSASEGLPTLLLLLNKVCESGISNSFCRKSPRPDDYSIRQEIAYHEVNFLSKMFVQAFSSPDDGKMSVNASAYQFRTNFDPNRFNLVEEAGSVKVLRHLEHSWSTHFSTYVIKPKSGIHEIEFRLECRGSYMIGLGSESIQKLDGNIGDHELCWAITESGNVINNKAVIGASRPLRAPNSVTITVRFNSDVGSLSYSINKSTFSSEFYISQGTNNLVPVISVFNKNDSVAILSVKYSGDKNICSVNTRNLITYVQAILTSVDKLISSRLNKGTSELCDVLNHPLITTLLPTLMVHLHEIPKGDRDYPHFLMQLFVYFATVIKRISSVLNYFGRYELPQHNRVSSFPVLEGRWKFKCCESGTVPSQEYEIDIQSRAVDCSTAYSLHGVGVGGESVALRGHMNGNRVVLIEKWPKHEYCRVDGRLSPCGQFFEGQFRIVNSNKSGLLHGRLVIPNSEMDSYMSDRVHSMCTGLVLQMSTLLNTYSTSLISGTVVRSSNTTTSSISHGHSRSHAKEEVSSTSDEDSKDLAYFLNSPMLSGGFGTSKESTEYIATKLKPFFASLPSSESNSPECEFRAYLDNSVCQSHMHNIINSWMRENVPELFNRNFENDNDSYPSLEYFSSGKGAEIDAMILQQVKDPLKILFQRSRYLTECRLLIIAATLRNTGYDSYLTRDVDFKNIPTALVEIWQSAFRIMSTIKQRCQKHNLSENEGFDPVIAKARFLLRLRPSKLASMVQQSIEMNKPVDHKDDGSLQKFFLSKFNALDKIVDHLLDTMFLGILRLIGFKLILHVLQQQNTEELTRYPSYLSDVTAETFLTQGLYKSFMLTEKANFNGTYFGLNEDLAIELNRCFEEIYSSLSSLLDRVYWRHDNDNQIIILCNWAFQIHPSQHAFLNKVGIFRLLNRILEYLREFTKTNTIELPKENEALKYFDSMFSDTDLFSSTILLQEMLKKSSMQISDLIRRLMFSLAMQVAFAKSDGDIFQSRKLSRMPSGPETLSQSLFDMLYSELCNCIQQLVEVDTPSDGIQGHKVVDKSANETYLKKILSLLFMAADSVVCRKVLNSPKWVNLLVLPIGYTSFIIERMIFKLLRRIVSNMNPMEFSASIPSFFSKRDSMCSEGVLDSQMVVDHDNELNLSASELLIKFLLDGVSVILPHEPSESNDIKVFLDNHKNSKDVINLSAECILALRVLLGSPNWRKVIFSAISKVFESDSSNLRNLIACVSMLGGHIDRIRVGGMVLIRPSAFVEQVDSFASNLSAASHTTGILLNMHDRHELVILERGMKSSQTPDGLSYEFFNTMLQGSVISAVVKREALLQTFEVPIVPDVIDVCIHDCLVGKIGDDAIPWLQANINGLDVKLRASQRNDVNIQEPKAQSMARKGKIEDPDNLFGDSDDDRHRGLVRSNDDFRSDDDDDDDDNNNNNGREILNKIYNDDDSNDDSNDDKDDNDDNDNDNDNDNNDNDNDNDDNISLEDLIEKVEENANSNNSNSNDNQGAAKEPDSLNDKSEHLDESTTDDTATARKVTQDTATAEELYSLVSLFKYLSNSIQSEKLLSRLLRSNIGLVRELFRVSLVETDIGGLDIIESAEQRWTNNWSLYYEKFSQCTETSEATVEPDTAPRIPPPSRLRGKPTRRPAIPRPSDDTDSPKYAPSSPSFAPSSSGLNCRDEVIAQALATMTNMGWPEHLCMYALQKCRFSVESAVHYLLENGDMLNVDAIEPEVEEPNHSRPKESDIDALVGMGFSKSLCMQACAETSGSMDDALAWLLAHQTTTDEPAAKPAEDEKVDDIVNPFVVISGSVKIGDDIKFKSSAQDKDFATIGAKVLKLTSGKWYYEVTLLTCGLFQIGWADAAFDCRMSTGVGDDSHSWAFDGDRVLLWNAEYQNSRPWGAKWCVGDVIGCAIDIDNRQISFFLNGFAEEIQMGVAFQDIKISSHVFPALSCSREQEGIVNLGARPFKFAPPEGYLGVAEHIARCGVSGMKDNYSFSSSFLNASYSREVSDSEMLPIYQVFTEREEGFIDPSKGYFNDRRDYAYEYPNSGSSAEPPKSKREALKNLTDLSRDLCVLYSRLSVLRIIHSLDGLDQSDQELFASIFMDSDDVPSSFIKYINNKVSEPDIRMSYLDGLFHLLRIATVTTRRTMIYFKTSSILPSSIPIPQNVGSLACVAGAPLMEELNSGIVSLITSMFATSKRCQLVDALLDHVALDLRNSLRSALKSSMVVDGNVTPVVVVESRYSVAKLVNSTNLQYSIWITTMLMHLFGVFAMSNQDIMSDDNSANIELLENWIVRLVNSWSLGVHSPSVLVCISATQILSGILQSINSNATQWGVSTKCIHMIANSVPLDQLSSAIENRLLHVNERYPKYSQYLKNLLELQATIKLLIDMPKSEDELLSPIDWEEHAGVVLSDSGWVTWSGTMEINGTDSPAVQANQISQRYFTNFAPLLPGHKVCKVSKDTPPIERCSSSRMETEEDDNDEENEGDENSEDDEDDNEDKTLKNPTAIALDKNQKVGVVQSIASWNGEVGAARVVLWDDGTEETVRWGGSERVYQVQQVHLVNGNYIVAPLPSNHMDDLNRAGFGKRIKCSVCLRLRKCEKRSSDSENVEFNVVGFLEIPRFSATYRMKGSYLSDGQFVLTEDRPSMFMSYFAAPKYGNFYWKPGTTYTLKPQDSYDPFDGELNGTWSFEVNEAYLKTTITGTMALQQEYLFRFDPSYKTPNLDLSSNCLTISRSGGGSQGIVYGDIGFSTGVHYWEFKIQRGDHAGHIYFGIAEKNERDVSNLRWSGFGMLTSRTFVGPDRNGAPYGAHLITGDHVGVLLDLNVGTLTFFVDGFRFGEHLIDNFGKVNDIYRKLFIVPKTIYYPVVGIRSNEKVCLTSRWISSIGINNNARTAIYDQIASVLTNGFAVEHCENDIIYRNAWNEWKRILSGKYLYVKNRTSLSILIDRSPIACIRASIKLGLTSALFHGDRVTFTKSAGRPLTKPEEAMIIGAYRGHLWYRLETQQGSGRYVESMQPLFALEEYDIDGIIPGTTSTFPLIPLEVRNIKLPRLPKYSGCTITIHDNSIKIYDGLEPDHSNAIGETSNASCLYALETRMNAVGNKCYRVAIQNCVGWICCRSANRITPCQLESSDAAARIDQAAIFAASMNVAFECNDVVSLHEAMVVWSTEVAKAGFSNLMTQNELLSDLPSLYESVAIDTSFEHFYRLCSTINGTQQWNSKSDDELSELVSKCASQSGLSYKNLSFSILLNGVKSLSDPCVLRKAKPENIIARYALLRTLNRSVEHVLPFINMPLLEESRYRDAYSRDKGIEYESTVLNKDHSPDSIERMRQAEPLWLAPSLSRQLRLRRKLIFMEAKKVFWDSVLQATITPTMLAQDEYEDPRELRAITINRSKAEIENLMAITDVNQRWKNSIFGQVFKESRSWRKTDFRRCIVCAGHEGQMRFFKVKFAGEGVIDHGGPYRAVFEQIVEELQYCNEGNNRSDYTLLPLLVQSNNRRTSDGILQDKFLLSPVQNCCPAVQEMMLLLGKLLGSAVRHNMNLGMDLSDMVWKPLVSSTVTLTDLKTVDDKFVQFLQQLTDQALSEEASAKQRGESIDPNMPIPNLELMFEVDLPDGGKVNLIPGGHETPVTMGNWRRFVLLAEKCRLCESSTTYKAFRDGLGQVLPLELFPLFTAKEIEDIICGVSSINVNQLKQCTEYNMITQDSDVVRYFWEVLEEFTPEEQTRFLQFAWARSRMSSTGQQGLVFKLQLKVTSDNPDDYLPTAQTCFFQLAIPNYSSKEVLRRKLLYAIYSAPNMDADVNLH